MKTILLFLCIATSVCALSLSVYEQLARIKVLNPLDGTMSGCMDGLGNKPLLLVILPQLGDFDTGEYVEQLLACKNEMAQANLEMRLIGIGDVGSAKRFSQFTSLPLEQLRVDPDASIHRTLDLHAGPGWDAPSILPEEVKPAANAWINYMAMCAGIAAPGTLREILRGYIGDRSAPERLRSTEQICAGPITITGTRRVQIGSLIDYENSWKDEEGYQRPVELATVRLKNMVEVLSNWREYVPNEKYLAYRGATFIFDKEEIKYEWRTPGVLTYSETMNRPLSFLARYIGEGKAANPLGYGEQS